MGYLKKLSFIFVASLLILSLTGCSFINRSANFLRRVTTSHGEKLISCENTEKFYYERLSEEQQRNYRILLAAYERMDSEVCGLTVSVDDMIQLNKLIILDCPELFWVANSGMYYDENMPPVIYAGGRYVPTYRYTRDEALELTERINAVCADFAAAHAGDSDYEKALAAYDYIIDTTDYDNDTANDIISGKKYDPVKDKSQCIVSVFINGYSVCAGYSAAYQYLLRKAGVFCASVIGTVPAAVEGESYNHQWNLLRLDGEYYYSDITWGETDVNKGIAKHEYFCVTGEEIAVTHTARDWVEYPDATAVECNYYYRTGNYYTELDMPLIGERIAVSIIAGKSEFALKFANAYDFDMFCRYLRSGDGMAAPLMNDFVVASELNKHFMLDKTKYSVIDDLRIVRFHFTYDNGDDL